MLTNALLPALERGAPSRIVNLSSVGNWAFGTDDTWTDPAASAIKYDPWARYGASKLANILHAKELQRRHGPRGITAVALHPGNIMGTSLFRSISTYAWLQIIPHIKLDGILHPEKGKTIPQGVATTVLAVVAPVSTDAAAAYDPVHPTISPGCYYSHCAPAAPNRTHVLAASTEAATRLWQLSEAQVGEVLARRSA